MKLGFALHLGFVRMSGRPLDAFRVLPVVLPRHLGKELGIPVPDVASLVRVLRDAVVVSTMSELRTHARRWLYERRLLIVHDRALLALVATASRELEAELRRQSAR